MQALHRKQYGCLFQPQSSSSRPRSRRMPATFTEKMRRKLAVGAAVEDLRSRCPYFYGVAAELDRMIVDGGLAPFVAATFTLRYRARCPTVPCLTGEGIHNSCCTRAVILL